MDSHGPERPTSGDLSTLETAHADPSRDRLSPSTARGGRTPKWPFVLAALLLAAGLATVVVFTWPINLPYYAFAPGPVSDAGDFVEVEADVVEDTGEMLFLTVTLDEVNAIEALQAWIDNEVDLVPREFVRPEGTSPEDLRRQNLDLMETSKDTAIVVALERLGYDVSFTGGGALITSVNPGSAADGVLMPNDVIVSVNEEPVEFSRDAIDLIGGHKPGDVVLLDVERPVGEPPADQSAWEMEMLEFEIELGPFIGLDEHDNELVDEDRGMVGVTLGNFNVETVLPFPIEIDSENIGGPSAGMMFTLEIMNQLTPEDLTRGKIIAGTGTINREGEVGSIGGVRQKVFAARDAGAEYILVPEGNYERALTADVEGIEIVSIATIDDALALLESL